MSSHLPHRLAISGLGLVVLAACTDSSTRAPASDVAAPQVRTDLVIPGCDVARITALVRMLSPSPITDPPFDLARSTNAVLVPTAGQLKLAQFLAFRLVDVLADPRVLAKLSDPNGPSVPPTKGEAISELVNLIFVCVQLPPPGDISGAFTPGGGAKVIGSGGGDLITRDGYAALRVPAGAVTGDHLFTIQPLSALAKTKTCLPPWTEAFYNPYTQYNQCYNYSVSPAVTRFATDVTVVECTLAESGNPYGTPNSTVHNRLRLASIDHEHPTQVKLYDRAPDPFPLNCSGMVIAMARPGTGERLLGPAWGRLGSFAQMVTRPFTPTLAYASDGLGGRVAFFTNFTTVDPVRSD